MKKQAKTARGRTIDMAALSAKYEHTKAVGNVLMNARGDRLNPDGSVRLTAEQIAEQDAKQKSKPVETAISNPRPVQKTTKPKTEELVEKQILEEVGRITRTREDGSKYTEIEYSDGSIETVEVEEKQQ